MKALNENNYDQIENFIEYEQFIANSYFYQLMRFTQYLLDFSEAGTPEFGKGFFTNMTEQIVANNKVVCDFGCPSETRKARTQDVKVSLPTYNLMPSYSEVPRGEPEWREEFDKDEGYLKIITRDDRVLS